MKIKKIIIMAIRGNTELRRKIKDALGISEPTLARYMSDNSDELTKASALKVIREQLELEDSEILEEEEDETEKVNAS